MIEQTAEYVTLTTWGWIGMVYFFGVIASFCVSIFTMDGLTFSKKKKFSWGALVIVLFFTAFSWIGLIAMIKFDDKHNGNSFRY
jgi:hypothetical protein